MSSVGGDIRAVFVCTTMHHAHSAQWAGVDLFGNAAQVAEMKKDCVDGGALTRLHPKQ